MIPSKPDEHGPFSYEYYHKWFNGKVKKGFDYGHHKICFSELYLFPLPGIPWFWNEWGRNDDCSLQSASPLYQSFNLFVRQALIDHHMNPSPAAKKQEDQRKGEEENAMPSRIGSILSLPSPIGKKLIFPSQLPYFHIVIEVRKINPTKRNNHASSRFIKNLDALRYNIEKMQIQHPSLSQQGDGGAAGATASGLVPIKVTAQDFSQLSFYEQIQLAHSASILISMHGAGTTQIFHMALGDRNCCGLLELFPDQSVDLYTAKGYGNLARMLGLYHTAIVADNQKTDDKGTEVNVDKITAALEKMTVAILTRESCLHDVKDTRFPIYSPSDSAFD
jgi:hypothetical protein